MKTILQERDLLKRISENDREAFRVLYLEYIPQVYRFTNSLLGDADASDEIVQHVFIKLWRHRKTLSEVMHLNAYLLRIARNEILNDLKKKQALQRSITSYSLERDVEVSPEEQFIFKESLQLAEEAMEKLSPKRKLIVELRTKQDLSLDEIADRLHISKNVVKKQLYKGVAFIKEYLIKRGRLTLWFVMYWLS